MKDKSIPINAMFTRKKHKKHKLKSTDYEELVYLCKLANSNNGLNDVIFIKKQMREKFKKDYTYKSISNHLHRLGFSLTDRMSNYHTTTHRKGKKYYRMMTLVNELHEDFLDIPTKEDIAYFYEKYRKSFQEL